MKDCDIVQIETKQLDECHKYIKTLTKLHHPLKEERIIFEFAVLKATRELLNYNVKELERNLRYWDFEPHKITPLTKLCDDGKGEICLRDFNGMNSFVNKIDHYLLIFQSISNFSFPNIDCFDEAHKKLTCQLIENWFDLIPKTYQIIVGLQAEHLHYALSRLTDLYLITMQPIEYLEKETFSSEQINDNRNEALSILNKKFPYLSEYDFKCKALLNEYEKDYYFGILSHLRELKETNGINYRLFPQISLISVLDKYKFDYKSEQKNELYSIVDFCIFDNNFNLKYAIEINGPSHYNDLERMARDMKVNKILQTAEIPLITFDIIEDRGNASKIAKNEIANKFSNYSDLRINSL